MKIQVSSSYKKMTTIAILSIVLFILLYFVLLLFAIGITVLSVLGGYVIFAFKPMIITFGLGIGLASLGFFILAFLFKFIFKKHKIDRSHLTEITREKEPILFKFIEDIVREAGTDFPKKVYLSSDVNASVFYDSSFWSMFFPIRKNLQIGLGLVNTITVQEFKAILAHEFGHFSQRSMKVGSYVYNVNQVIYNMLYDNESFDNMIQRWANISGYFSFFIIIAVRIINSIQWVLTKMYSFVNLNYMALSREMEFHADEVAANIAGYLPLKESLLRMDLANYSFNSVLGFYDTKIIDNVKSDNIFQEQVFVLNFLAKESNMDFKNGLPLVSELELSKYNKSKLTIKDQWASHPSVEERVVKLEKLNIVKSNSSNVPAISLFNDKKVMEEVFTEKIFSNVVYTDKLSSLSFDEFQRDFVLDFHKNRFDKIFNGYYDNKNPIYFDVSILDDIDDSITLETLFSKENVDMVYDHVALLADKNILTNIMNKDYVVKTFDYDGQKYNASDSKTLILQLDQKIEQLSNAISINDKMIFSYFYKIAGDSSKKDLLKEKYKLFFNTDKECDDKMELYSSLMNATSFINVVTNVDQIESKFNNVYEIEELFRNEIRDMLEQKQYESEITKQIRDNFEKYLSKKWVYFIGQNYRNDALQIFYTALNDYSHIVSKSFFVMKKDLLIFKAQLVNKEFS